jgi:integrase
MRTVESYLQLAQRPNTERSYAAALRHFEIEWRGLLPATPDVIAEYLAAFAPSLSVNTLQARLAGLSRWHLDHGFPDPTKSQLVRRVLKGIRTAHNRPERHARPVEFDRLEHVCAWLDCELLRLGEEGRRAEFLRRARDQAMLLIGFWRGFRADELTSLYFEHITVRTGADMTCFIPRSKTDRRSEGRSFECPALSRLCPVTAYERWMQAAGFSAGPVFCRIDRWGHISAEAIAPGSVVPWLRDLFRAAGVGDPDTYSSHSLRRGFANWAKSSGWDVKELMEYVGWRDMNSALRYLERRGDDLSAKFEQGLQGTAPAGGVSPPPRPASRVAGTTAGSNIVQLPRRTP